MAKSKKVKSGTRSVDRSQTKAIKENAAAIAELQAPVELKFLDTKFTVLAGSASFATLLSKSMTSPPVWVTNVAGSNDTRINSREGNQIIARSLTMDAYVTLPGTSVGIDISKTLSRTIVRVMAVQYPQGCGDSYELQDILETGTDQGGLNAATSFLKIAPVEKYRVLFDRSIPLYNAEQILIPQGYPISGGEKYRVKCSFKHKFTKAQQEIEWEDSNLGLGPVRNDVRLWVFIDDINNLSGNALDSSARPALIGTLRLRYNDL